MKPRVGMDYTILSAGFDKKQVFDGVFFYPSGAWLQRRESNDISLSLVTCRGKTGKGGLNGLKKYFDCNSKNYFEVRLCHMQGSILWCKAVFITVCTGVKNLSDFGKSGNTAVGKENFYG